MVTHYTTSHPARSLCMAERTGCPILYGLWLYVIGSSFHNIIFLCIFWRESTECLLPILTNSLLCLWT